MEFSYVVIGLIVIGLVYFVVKEEKEKSSSTPSTPAPLNQLLMQMQITMVSLLKQSSRS